MLFLLGGLAVWALALVAATMIFMTLFPAKMDAKVIGLFPSVRTYGYKGREAGTTPS